MRNNKNIYLSTKKLKGMLIPAFTSGFIGFVCSFIIVKFGFQKGFSTYISVITV